MNFNVITVVDGIKLPLWSSVKNSVDSVLKSKPQSTQRKHRDAQKEKNKIKKK
jgi:hypothetical protein